MKGNQKMSIPTPSKIEIPMLHLFSQGQYYSRPVEELADKFSLTPEERCRTRPNGIDKIFAHNCCTAQTRLKRKGLVEYETGTLRVVTPKGKRALQKASC